MVAESLIDGALLGRIVFSETWQSDFQMCPAATMSRLWGWVAWNFLRRETLMSGRKFLGYFIVSKLIQLLPPHPLFMAGAFIGIITHTTSDNRNHQFA